MGVVARRFEVWLVALNPTQGHEINKTRPCVIVSPDELNRHLRTVIVAPMTTKGHDYPFRVPVTFQQKKGRIVIDQIRIVDKQRLVKRLGAISKPAAARTLVLLGEMFAG